VFGGSHGLGWPRIRRRGFGLSAWCVGIVDGVAVDDAVEEGF
jgi:hypothetical protein